MFGPTLDFVLHLNHWAWYCHMLYDNYWQNLLLPFQNIISWWT